MRFEHEVLCKECCRCLAIRLRLGINERLQDGDIGRGQVIDKFQFLATTQIPASCNPCSTVGKQGVSIRFLCIGDGKGTREPDRDQPETHERLSTAEY